MKLILDEWIVREVIDTLYMARTTFLGITGLDSPQDVEKKSANETAITRRISKAIDIIQQSEQPHISETLDEAAKEYCKTIFHKPFSENPQEEHILYDPDKYDGFIAGAEWKDKQVNRDEIFHDGMRYAYDQLMKEAVEGIVERSPSGKAISVKQEGGGCYWAFGNEVAKQFNLGDKVKLIAIKEE